MKFEDYFDYAVNRDLDIVNSMVFGSCMVHFRVVDQKDVEFWLEAFKDDKMITHMNQDQRMVYYMIDKMIYNLIHHVDDREGLINER